MLRQRCPIVLLMVCCLPACTAMDTIREWTGRDSNRSRHEPQLTREFNLDDPAERDVALESVDHELMQEEIAKTSRGSQASVMTDFEHRFLGTFVGQERERVELMNCLCKEVVPGPDGRPQCKTSHVPYLSFEISNLTHFSVIAPPPADQALKELSFDSSDYMIASIVLKSGRNHQLGQQPERSVSNPSTKSAESENEENSDLPRGAQVTLVDQTGHRFDGTVLSTGNDNIEVMNCIWREVVPGRNGQKQIKTCHVPFQTFPTTSITSVGIIAAAPPDFAPPDLDTESASYTVAEFVSISGRTQRWEPPRERAASNPPRAVRTGYRPN